jgi:hypothetical protein
LWKWWKSGIGKNEVNQRYFTNNKLMENVVNSSIDNFSDLPPIFTVFEVLKSSDASSNQNNLNGSLFIFFFSNKI